MDNHPIPQDVTGFQFRLIGNMTVKQFAYVAAGTVLAVIVYYAPLPLLIKAICIPLFGGIGAALAFLPIEGRPMDVMVSYFIKDLVTPTQYLYHKTGGMLALSLIHSQPQKKEKEEKTKEKQEKAKEDQKRQHQLSQFLKRQEHHHASKLDQREELFLQAVFDPTINTQILSMDEEQKKQTTLPEDEALRVKVAVSPQEKENQLEKEAEAIKRELAKAREEEQQKEQTHQPVEAAHEHVEELNAQLQEIEEQKQQLEQELQKLKAQLETHHKPQQKPEEPQQPLKASDNVRSVPLDKAQSIGLPALPEVPNIVIGIVKDPRGNVLPNILVDIKDKDGNPVRAFKTNGLGQFASATPLPRGQYTVEFEDTRGRNNFETVAIEANDEIMLPLEIISQDERERLRQELFT